MLEISCPPPNLVAFRAWQIDTSNKIYIRLLVHILTYLDYSQKEHLWAFICSFLLNLSALFPCNVLACFPSFPLMFGLNIVFHTLFLWFTGSFPHFNHHVSNPRVLWQEPGGTHEGLPFGSRRRVEVSTTGGPGPLEFWRNRGYWTVLGLGSSVRLGGSGSQFWKRFLSSILIIFIYLPIFPSFFMGGQGGFRVSQPHSSVEYCKESPSLIV